MKPFDQLKVVEHLEFDCNIMLNNILEIIPEKYRTTSVSEEARCDLSYNTGRRDTLVELLIILEHMNVQLTAEGEDMLEDMYKESRSKHDTN